MKDDVHAGGGGDESARNIQKNLTYDKELKNVNPFFFDKPLNVPEIEYQNNDLINFS